MIEKIKDFFAKKAVIITEGVIIAVCSIGLFIGGINAVDYITKVAAGALGVVSAFIAAVKIIFGIFEKSE